MTIDLGTIARTRRQELGLLQREVADRACCCQSTVKAFESRKRGINMDIAMSILGALGLKVVIEEDK